MSITYLVKSITMGKLTSTTFLRELSINQMIQVCVFHIIKQHCEGSEFHQGADFQGGFFQGFLGFVFFFRLLGGAFIRGGGGAFKRGGLLLQNRRSHDRLCAETLEKELLKRKELFTVLKLKGIYRKFTVYMKN